MITVINKGNHTFNAIRVGMIAEIDKKFLEVYEGHGFEVFEEVEETSETETTESDEETSETEKPKKQNLKKIAPKTP